MRSTAVTEHQITRGFVWSATALTLAGALCTSLKWDPLNIYLLNAGCVLFVIWAVRIRDRAMITVNVGLLLIYLLGIMVRSSAW